MNKPIIGLVGGSGFVGSVLANRLVETGHAVRVLTRRRDNARELWLLPDSEIIEVDYGDLEQLNDALAGCSAVVNLVSILNERGDNGAGFRRVNIDLPMRLVKACKAAEVDHLVQLSAINADSFAPSYYLRTKGEAEKLMAAEAGQRLKLSVVRPSVIFGPNDGLTRRFAQLLRLAPLGLPLAGARTRFQPVYVNDVARAIERIVDDRQAAGQRYELGGPDIMTLRDIVEYVARQIGSRAPVIPLGGVLAALQANVCEFIPGKPFSRDNLRSLSEDSVCAGGNGLVLLGIEPTPMSAVVPGYLGGHDRRGRYYDYRSHAGRDAA